MGEVKWIKLYTNVFDNRKIRQIKKMPEGKSILIIWFEILCLAGQTNDNGMIYFTKDVPFTLEMLAVEFEEDIRIVRMALEVFEKFGMMTIIDNILQVSNWEKYQNVKGLDTIREQNRIRQQKYRENQRQLSLSNKNENSNVTVTLRNALDKEEDKDKELDIELKRDSAIASTPFNDIIDYWNEKVVDLPKVKTLTANRKTAIKSRLKDFDLETIKEVIDLVAISSFLNGRNDRFWKANFDWVMKAGNFVKILEGNYNDSKTSKGKTAPLPDWYDDYEKDLKAHEKEQKEEVLTEEEIQEILKKAKEVF